MFEKENSKLSLDERITKLRQMSHKKDLPFDSVIGVSSGTEYLDTRAFDRSKWQILEGSLQVVRTPDGNKVDMYHLLVGLDVLPRKVENQTQYALPIGQNYSAATWAGDIGAAAGDAFLGEDETWEKEKKIPGKNDPAREKHLAALQERYYTTRAPESDLMGNIDMGVDEMRTDKKLDTIAKLLTAFYGDPISYPPQSPDLAPAKRQNAIERFLKHYGFNTTTSLATQPASYSFKIHILLFANSWITNRRYYPLLSIYSAKDIVNWYVSPMTIRFLKWLDNLAKQHNVIIPESTTKEE